MFGQEAIQFADLVYQLTGDFPSEERFGLTNQMRRAAVSISSNLAEGSSRVSRTDFSRFVEIVTGSLFEIVSQSTIALRRKMITQDDYNRIYATAESRAKRSADCAGHCVRRNSQVSTTNYQPPAHDRHAPFVVRLVPARWPCARFCPSSPMRLLSRAGLLSKRNN